MSFVRTSERQLLSLLTLTLSTAGLTWYGFINATPTMTPIAIATAFSPLIPEPLGETIVPAQGVVDIPYMVHIVHVLLLLYSIYNS